MINGKTILAIIPARGGSKGLPLKNILPLAGKPLIAWTIDAAKKSKYIDRCIISTDDKKIANVSIEYGGDVPFLRPAEIATDTANSTDVIIHAINTVEEKYDLIVLLQPTSPLRGEKDISLALELMEKEDASALVSMANLRHPIEWTSRLTSNLRVPDLVNKSSNNTGRQEFDQKYELNGAIFISIIDLFIKERSFITKQTIAYIMPVERSVDIDDIFDFGFAEYLMRNTLTEKIK